MKMKMKKIKIFCIGLACLLASGTFAFADYDILHETEFTEQIGNGITYTENMIFTENGWLPIHITEGDLSENGVSLSLLSEEKANARAALSVLALAQPGAVAVVNGDFFDTGLSVSMGPVIKDGILLSSSIKDPGFNTAWTDADGMLQIGGAFEETYTLNNLSSRSKLSVELINKPYLKNDRIIVYDKAWEGLPPQKPDAIYMGVANGQVTGFETEASSLDIDSLDFIVAAIGTKVSALTESFKQNQLVNLEMELIPSIENITDAFGGGSLLLKNGAIPSSFSMPIPGRNPRTALGVDKSGSRFWLLTVDGRSSSAAGMTEAELASYMKNLGAWNAINLDGGGSTEMLARRLGETNLSIANTPSGSAERCVANAIAATSLKTNLAASDFRIDVSDERVVDGTSRLLETLFFDKNRNPAIGNPNEVEWSVAGNGLVKSGRFYPEGSGRSTITGTYKGNSRSITLLCVENPVGIRLYPRNISLDLNGTAEIKAIVHTSEGYEVSVDFEDISATVPDRIGSLSGNTFSASNRASSGKVSVSLGTFTDEIPVSIGYTSFVFNDFENPGDTFSGYPEAVTGSYGIDGGISKIGDSSGVMTYDFSGSDATRAAYLNLNKKIYSTPSQIGLWIKGDNGGGHWLRAKITDNEGKSSTLDLARYVDWDGWRFVKASIPSGVSFPIRLEQIYLVETDPENKASGQIWFDELTAFYKTPSSGQVNVQELAIPKDENLLDNAPENPLLTISVFGNTRPVSTMLDRLIHIRLAALAEKSNFALAPSPISEDLNKRLKAPLIGNSAGYSATGGTNLLVLNLDNSSKTGLRTSSASQIPWLRDQLEKAGEKNILLSMSEPWNFSDPLEEDLVLEWLEDYRARTGGKTYAIVPSRDGNLISKMKSGLKIIAAPSTPKIAGIDIFTDLNLMTIYITNDGLKYTSDPIYKRP
ncbi:MAG: phosphodiester glycosidase family protein [Peptostreptococcaceae bacterium]|nr:phosphodiester glycosidase family protein [Peptostreptococcaceae bacterium]